MDKFRENAQVLHAAVSKRRLVATLTKRESRLQIFNSVFTRNRSQSESSNSDEGETDSRSSQRHRSRIKARLDARAAAAMAPTPSVDGSFSATAPASGPQSEGVTTARDPEGLFDYLSPLSSTEDDCEERDGFFGRSICLTFVEGEIKDMPPWIEAVPLPPMEDRPLAQDSASQTDFPMRTKADAAVETDTIEMETTGTQFEVYSDETTVLPMSAADTMFLELTRRIYLTELLTWYLASPASQTQQIDITPRPLTDGTIISFHFYPHLEERIVFVIKEIENITIEIWSLSNLICPKTIPTTVTFKSNQSIQCCYNENSMFLSNNHQIVIIDIAKLEQSRIINVNNYKILNFTTFSTTETHLLTSDGDTFYYFSMSPETRLLRQFDRSPLFSEKVQKVLLVNDETAFAINSINNVFILSAYNPCTGLHLNSTDESQFKTISPKFQKESFLSHQFFVINKDNENAENCLVFAFDCQLQVAVIVNVDNFIKFGEIEYRFDFSYPEIPVYFCVPIESLALSTLFSVDSAGRISQWNLLSKSRKKRAIIMSTSVKNSISAFSFQNNKFMFTTPKTFTILALKK